MAENVFQFILVVAVSFGVLVVLTSYFRFQRRVAVAASVEASGAVGEEPFIYGLAGRLATGPRNPDPFLVVRVDLEDKEALLDRLTDKDQALLLTFITDRLRRRIREKDTLLCLETGRHGLLIAAERGEAEGILRRIASAFADDVFRTGSGEGIALRVRVGAAACPEDGAEVDALLKAVEQTVRSGRPGSWAMASRPEAAEDESSDDPLADVPPSQRHLVDPVTGVLNEDHLGGTMQRFVARARNDGRPAAITCCRIDQFDRYREHYGAAGADVLLASVGQFLKHAVREDDLIARYGDGQFVVMMACEPGDALKAVVRLAAKVQERPVRIEETPVKIKMSAGIAGCPDHGTVSSEIFKLALVALSAAAKEGQGKCRLYEKALVDQAPQRTLHDAF